MFLDSTASLGGDSAAINGSWALRISRETLREEDAMPRRAWLVAGLVSLSILCRSTSTAGFVCYEYRYAPNLVSAVQRLLQKEGLYSGSVDGKWGPRTQAGVSKFQKRKGIQFDTPMKAASQGGQLEEQTLKAMFGDDAPEGVTLIENPYHAPQDMWSKECK
jgi:hypothetical protein